MLHSLNSKTIWAWASGDVNSGKCLPIAISMAGIKSKRGNGGLKSMLGVISALQLVSKIEATTLDSARNMRSVRVISSSISA